MIPEVKWTIGQAAERRVVVVGGRNLGGPGCSAVLRSRQKPKFPIRQGSADSVN